MRLKTLQWNIGGGRYRDANSDPLGDTYKNNKLNYFFDYINLHNPDIVTLQESHSNDSYSIGEEITKNTELKYFADYGIDQSHIDPTMRLTVSIISKYPISVLEQSKFVNPNLKIIWENQEFPLQDKGVLKASVSLPNNSVDVESTHLFPLRKCNAELMDESLNYLRKDIENKLISEQSKKLLIQGDFNINSQILAEYFAILISGDTQEVPIKEPTSPRGRNYDHIIYKGLKLVDFTIDSKVLTDHYSLISNFELST
mgnify:CR=1 FL=1